MVPFFWQSDSIWPKGRESGSENHFGLLLSDDMVLVVMPGHILKRRIESMMWLRPRQGNLRLVFRLFSLVRGLPSIRLK